eukprot:Platyproteum_vivax@DN10225_c0_g1_i1.p1
MPQLSENAVEQVDQETHPADDKDYWVKEYKVTSCLQWFCCGSATLFLEAEHLTHTSNCMCGCCKDKGQNEFAELTISSCFGCCNYVSLGEAEICPGCCGCGYKDMMREIGELVEIRKKTHGAHAQVGMLETLVAKVDGIENDMRRVLAILEAKPPQQYMN